MASPSMGAVKYGGRTLNGSPRVTSWDAGGLWRLTLEDIILRTREQILTAQALDALLDGGATPIAVFRYPGARNPDGTSAGVPHSDGAPFSDGSLYASGSESRVAEPALMGSTLLVIERPAAAPLLIGGEDFSLLTPDGPRMHRGAQIETEEVIGDWRRYTLRIRVPLRADAIVGQDLNYRNPACMMRMTNYQDFAAMLERNRWGTISAEFVEA